MVSSFKLTVRQGRYGKNTDSFNVTNFSVLSDNSIISYDTNSLNCISNIPVSNRFNILNSLSPLDNENPLIPTNLPTNNMSHDYDNNHTLPTVSLQSYAPPQSNNLFHANNYVQLNNTIQLNNPIPPNVYLQIHNPIPPSPNHLPYTTTEPHTGINPLSHNSINTPPTNAQLLPNNSLPPMHNDNLAPPYHDLCSVRTKHPTNIIIAHININSFRLKFSEIDYIIRENSIQILAIAETKLDESDNSNLFHIEGYSMLRADKRKNSGGLLMYLSNKIPHRQINFNSTSPNIEILCCEIIIDKKDTWIVCAMYKSPTVKNSEFESIFQTLCEELLCKYDKVIIMGDLNFNLLKPDCFLKTMLPVFDLKNLINSPTCKKSINPTLIDVLLTNVSNRFLQSFSIDIGLSDFHNLIGCVMRKHIPKPTEKMVQYRKVKQINYTLVKEEISSLSLGDLAQNPDAVFNMYHNHIISIFNKHAPLKEKRIKAGHFPFMTKELKQAIYQRNMMRNKYYKYKTSHYHVLYKEKRNIVNSIKRNLTTTYIKEKCHSGVRSKDFWPTMKPFFSKSSLIGDDIILRESDRLITDEQELCETFNTFFVQIGNDIGTQENMNRPIQEIINDYNNHPSITIINSTKPIRECSFKFLPTTQETIIKIITEMETKKSSGYDDIPPAFIQTLKHELALPLSTLINACIDNSVFPSNLKMADISPVYKKKDKLNKDNYRSINLLPIISKIFEKVLNNQLTDFANTFYSAHLSGFRKKHGCSDIISLMTENWRRALDNKRIVGIMAIDLSKAFDCMPHGLLLAKLHNYDIDINACTLIKSYLYNRKQRVKIGNTTSNWTTAVKGVPQGSILGPTLFNIFINDLLLTHMNSTIYNYADDNTLSITGEHIDDIKSTLEADAKIAITWFDNNMMKANPSKFQIMFIGKHITSLDHQIKLNEFTLQASHSIFILGIDIDEHLTFTEHINTICSKTAKQINALYRIKSNLDNSSRKTIFNSYISSSFNYCSTIWMFTTRGNLNKLDKLLERALRLTYNNYISTYEQLLHDTNTLCIYKRCLKTLATEMYKIKRKWSPSYLLNLFLESDISTMYSLRDTNKYVLPKYNGKKYGYHCFSFIGPKIWNKLPVEIKNCNSIPSLKHNLHIWLSAHSLTSAKDEYF